MTDVRNKRGSPLIGGSKLLCTLSALLLNSYEKNKKILRHSAGAGSYDFYGLRVYRLSIWLEQFAKPHKKSWDEDKRRYNLYIKKPLGNKKLSWFTSTKIRQWHQGITKLQKQRAPKGVTVSTTTANRALSLLSTMFNQAASEIKNPCKGIPKFKEQSRERWLKPDELKCFFAALDDPKTPTDLRDYITHSLFTGARRSNVLGMKWSDVNMTMRTWTIPADESKNSTSISIPLVGLALEVLERRKKGSQCLCPAQ